MHEFFFQKDLIEKYKNCLGFLLQISKTRHETLKDTKNCFSTIEEDEISQKKKMIKNYDTENHCFSPRLDHRYTLILLRILQYTTIFNLILLKYRQKNYYCSKKW